MIVSVTGYMYIITGYIYIITGYMCIVTIKICSGGHHLVILILRYINHLIPVPDHSIFPEGGVADKQATADP